MSTFRIADSDLQDGQVTLRGDAARHLGKVLRAREGEIIRLTNGSSKLYEGRIESVGREVAVKITRELRLPPAPYPVHLFLSLLKREKLEFLIEKAVELNVEAVHLVVSKRSIRQDLSGAKWERLGKIADAALNQCGRIVPLQIKEPADFEKTVDAYSGMAHLWMNEREESKTLKRLFSAEKISPPYGIWIGPEGGWDSSETERALSAKFHSLSMGSIILRAETAALHSCSQLIALAFG